MGMLVDEKTMQLSESLSFAESVVSKSYLYDLDKYEIANLPEEIKGVDISDYTRLYRFVRLVKDSHEDVNSKMISVFNTVYSIGATVVTIVCGDEDRVEYYMGVVDKSTENPDVASKGKIFESAMKGNFPGIEIINQKKGNIQGILDNIERYEYVSSVSVITSEREGDKSEFEKYVQGIEHLVDSMEDSVYTCVIIADPVDENSLLLSRRGLESIYSQFSPLKMITRTITSSDSISLSESETKGITDTLSHSTSLSTNYSETNGWNKSTSITKSKTASKNYDGLITGATAVIGGALAISGVGLPLAAGVVAGGAVVGKLVGTRSKTKGETKQYGETHNVTTGSTESLTETQSQSRQSSNTKGISNTKSIGENIQMTSENYTAKAFLEKIENQIKRIDKCDGSGAFNCCAYILSNNPQTTAVAANIYNGLKKGDLSSYEASHVNYWMGNDAKKVKRFIQKMSHPQFMSPYDSKTLLNAATIHSSEELSTSMGLPKKSINGLSVVEMASFGRNVNIYNEAESISMGKIYHMGKKWENSNVRIDKDSLAMHTFVTGSTGSGKSNTIYNMIDNLNDKDVNFMIIEPAKGEYKNIFGNRNDVKVFGTNPYLADILKINPFSFADNIHVLEHIDRLIDIFNVCWPMYAAMPAVLKNAIEKSYLDCGWELVESKNCYEERIYPTFMDVTRNVRSIIDSSDYDSENKGAYKGALLTRLESLSFGLNKLIFSDDELEGSTLFDNNVIVDLSRLGSIETKSLIMGMLIIKMQEYRMAKKNKMNSTLRHVTVLEEAHNLLKKTSTEQSQESSNITGKSVEMLTNAIAEMRTFGEGFIIADQAPGLLDKSVIRNTNTKIILRLPDLEDRELVGRAANLDDEQIRELSKLPCGVAAIYQNDWVESVLCKVEKYDCDDSEYSYDMDEKKVSKQKKDYSELIKMLLRGRVKEIIELDYKKVEKEIENSDFSSKTKIQLKQIMDDNINAKDSVVYGKNSMNYISDLIVEILNCRNRINYYMEMGDDSNRLQDAINEDIKKYTENLSSEITLAVSQCILHEAVRIDSSNFKVYENWKDFFVNKRW
ncbi:helicase HerA domain-containing protein [Eubacterium xylanophilum]|uniref:helicase HerA domain-containing protein n=1 Tax=Eubacterium xylanophilum TaxID=39497 RepID=UPI0004ADDE61|nr:DUF87 domain-containing protein [Eubacterium xylanophilum]